MNIFTKKSEKNIYDLIQYHRGLIYDEKNWNREEMWKIAEVTYSYNQYTPKKEGESNEEYEKNKKKLEINGKNININTTLFCSLGGLELEGFSELNDEEKLNEIKKAEDILTKKIQEKLILIDLAIEELKNIKPKNKIEQYSIDIFINSIQEKKDLLKYCLNGLPYELEKAGIILGLTKETEKEIDKKQEEIDKKLFGGKIKENPYETKKCYEYILSNFEEKKHKLSTQEKERFKYFLSKIEALLEKDYKYTKKDRLKNYLDEFSDVKVGNKEYILGFNLFVEALEKLKHVIKRDENAKSVSDGPEGVLFPTSKKFESITLKRFFTLNTHEIEVHSITDHNNEQLIGTTRGAKSTIKDEGLAILMETLLQYGDQIFKTDEKTGKKIIDPEKVPIRNAFTFILMGELLNNEELFEFLSISEKLEADTIEVKSRFDRLKRSNKNRVQYKDTSYIRGLFQAIEEINKYILSDGKEGIGIEDMFLGKISFEETHKLKAIKEEKEKKGENLDIVMPIFSSDSIIFSINSRLEGKKVNKEEFLSYLQNKYPIFDFTKEQIDTISRKTKEKIAGVANIAIQSITEKNIKNIPGKQNQLKHLLNIIYSKHKGVIKRAHDKMEDKRKEAVL